MAHFQMWKDIVIKMNGHVITSYSGGGYPLMLHLLSYAQSTAAREMQKSTSFLHPDTGFEFNNISTVTNANKAHVARKEKIAGSCYVTTIAPIHYDLMGAQKLFPPGILLMHFSCHLFDTCVYRC